MNIVIVEDSELIRTQLARLIATQPRVRIVGYASEEGEAVDLILATRPDAVLLDLSLAPGSGVRVLERIRAAGSGTRVLVLTNNTSEALRQVCRQLGISGFFDKTEQAHKCLQQLYEYLPPLPDSEGPRLQALNSVRLLDTPEQERFDDIARLASEIADTPMALISLLDNDRQWFLSHIGLDIRETSRSIAFCAYTILRPELMEVPDARLDKRFHDNPLVRGDPHVCFYAGGPLVLPSGENLGTLCVLDTKPRQLTASQKRALKTLTTSAINEIELRRRVIGLEQEMNRRLAAEAHVMHLATRDVLTALPNRAALRDRVEQHLLLARRRQTQPAFLFIDIDRFKLINDTLGHDVGDEALVTCANRISLALRDSDTVARLGGDEFAVILPSVDSTTEALLVADKLIDALATPLEIRGHRLHLNASIGIAIYPEHGDNGDQLLRHADLAMYKAKQSGGGRAFLFSPGLNARAEELLALDNDLRDAIVRRELEVHYQPQVAMGSTRLCGMEALVRWQHPHLGLLPPNHFIPFAEERGIILDIGRLVLDKALAQLSTWDALGIHVPHLAINVSPAELNASFTANVEAALARHGIAHERLELEITESALTGDGIETLGMLAGLRERGVSIAVDDFGVGYSSLAQLRRLPIDTLKIDRSFVTELDSNAQDAAIVQAVVTMARSLALRTVAEGAETEAHIQALEAIGCDCVQGYFLARPMPALEIPGWLHAFNGACADLED